MEEKGTSLFKKKLNFMPALKRKRHKADHCLNCGTSFDIETNYCPNCGQENDHKRASFRNLIADFFHNYFSLDSQLGNSLFPFFFKPGFLTTQFIEGKRAYYVNPVRLYLILSLVFFFIFNMVGRNTVFKGVDKINETIEAIPDSTVTEMAERSEEIRTVKADSVIQVLKETGTIDDLDINIQTDEDSASFLSEKNVATYWRLRKDKHVSVDEMLDSLETSQLSSFQYRLVRNLVRLEKSEREIALAHLLKNLPLMMLIMLPFFALVLMLLYIRQDQYYITHLIHAVYLHAFAFVFYGLAFTSIMLRASGTVWAPRLMFISMIIVTIHSYFSFKQVYKQSWGKTLIKFLLVGMFYSFLMIFGVLGELFLSLLTF